MTTSKRHHNQSTVSHQHSRIIHKGNSLDGLSFFNQLTSDQLFDEVESLLPDHRERLFPPTETLSLFLSQAVSDDRSCQNAVNQSATTRMVNGLPRCSTGTGGYCRARKRLPLEMIKHLTLFTGKLIDQHVSDDWRWRGRHVRIVDGTTVTLPDTPENQQAYPQISNQKPGLGFPICHLVAITCLASGALLNAETCRYGGKGSDEQSLLRRMLNTLNSNDILLADAFYATYFLLAECKRSFPDVVALSIQH